MDAALTHALRLLETNPALAAKQAREILAAVPAHPGAVLLLGMAANAERDFAHAAAVLDPLTRAQPKSARAWLELGVARIGHKEGGRVTWRFAFNATAPVLPGFDAKRGFALL